MTIHLDKNQMRLIQNALEHYRRSIQDQLKEDPKPEVERLIAPDLFQVELLTTWFDRQREMECS